MMVKNPWTGAYGDVELTSELQEHVAMMIDDELLVDLEGLELGEWFAELNKLVGDDEFGSLVIGS